MKKVIFSLMAVAVLSFVSCTTDPVKKYEGSYKVDIDRSVTTMGATTDQPAKGLDMNIVADGDNGKVRIVFPPAQGSGECGEQCGMSEEMVFTGKVDKDGLHIDAKSHAYNAPDGRVSMTYSAADASLEGKTLKWSQSVEGTANFMDENISITETDNYTATKQD